MIEQFPTPAHLPWMQYRTLVMDIRVLQCPSLPLHTIFFSATYYTILQIQNG
jgi:hypothetical protein